MNLNRKQNILRIIKRRNQISERMKLSIYKTVQLLALLHKGKNLVLTDKLEKRNVEMKYLKIISQEN